MNKTIEIKCQKGIFKHYISLGHCCHIAGNLEKLGLRSASMPYDWNITLWKAIEDSVKNNFDNYLVYDKLYQFKDRPQVYENCEAGVSFVHDFVGHLSLKKQFKNVEEKYKRRISKFYQHIQEPTLFFRYCLNAEEVYEIDMRYNEIIDLFKKHNQDSEVVFLSHSSIDMSKINNIEYLYIIEKPEDEQVSTRPLLDCEYLCSVLSNAKFEDRERNLQFNKEKQNKKSVTKKLKKKMQKFFSKFHKEYVYEKRI